MFEVTGKIKDFTLDFTTGKPKLTVELNEKQSAMAMFDELKDTDKLTLRISQYREKRSLEANNYCWHLCGELAEKLSNEKVKYTKEDIYRKAIKEIGVWRDDEIEPADVKWRQAAWELIGTGWFSERVDFTADGNKEIIRFYYGSSRYNKKQMSRLIDNIVIDCQEQGIQTKTPAELARLTSLWGESIEKHSTG